MPRFGDNGYESWGGEDDDELAGRSQGGKAGMAGKGDRAGTLLEVEKGDTHAAMKAFEDLLNQCDDLDDATQRVADVLVAFYGDGNDDGTPTKLEQSAFVESLFSGRRTAGTKVLMESERFAPRPGATELTAQQKQRVKAMRNARLREAMARESRQAGVQRQFVDRLLSD